MPTHPSSPDRPDGGTVHLSQHEALVRRALSSTTLRARVLGVRPAGPETGAIYLDRLVHHVPGECIGAYRCTGGVATVLHGPLPQAEGRCASASPEPSTETVAC